MNEFNGIDMFKKAFNIYNKLLGEVAKQNNLTLNQIKILMFLEKNSENNIAKNIVEGLGTTKSHVSMSLSELEKNGYIEKLQDKKDRKKSRLQLTEKSIKIIQKGKKVQKNVKEIMFEGIKKEDIEILNNVSQKIEENLEKYNKVGG